MTALQAFDDRCLHLGKVKGKLEQSLDECEDALEREKKTRNDAEKMKRKTELDLKVTQEAVADLERTITELGQALQRKEKEQSSLAAKIEDEQTLGGKFSKQVSITHRSPKQVIVGYGQVKCLTERLGEVEEELVVERQHRAKAEKNRFVLLLLCTSL